MLSFCKQVANFLFMSFHSKNQPFEIELEIAQALPSYDPAILRVYRDCEPAGITFDEKDAKVPLYSVYVHTFSRILQNPKWELEMQLERFKEQNGGTLNIDCYSALGLDGSNHHPIYKRNTEASLLDGNCLISCTIPLQMVTKVQNRKIVLHSNALFAASDSARPVS